MVRSLVSMSSGVLFAATLIGAPLVAGSASASVVFSDGFETQVVNHTGPSGSAGGYDNYGTGAAIGPWTVVGPAGRTDVVSVVTGDFAQNGIAFTAQSGAQWADLAGAGRERQRGRADDGVLRSRRDQGRSDAHDRGQ